MYRPTTFINECVNDLPGRVGSVQDGSLSWHDAPITLYLSQTYQKHTIMIHHTPIIDVQSWYTYHRYTVNYSCQIMSMGQYSFQCLSQNEQFKMWIIHIVNLLDVNMSDVRC